MRLYKRLRVITCPNCKSNVISRSRRHLLERFAAETGNGDSGLDAYDDHHWVCFFEGEARHGWLSRFFLSAPRFCRCSAWHSAHMRPLGGRRLYKTRRLNSLGREHLRKSAKHRCLRVLDIRWPKSPLSKSCPQSLGRLKLRSRPHPWNSGGVLPFGYGSPKRGRGYAALRGFLSAGLSA